MKRFIEGENRLQSTLFPERLDDYIAEDNAVRVVDAFVEKLVAIDGSKFKAVNSRDKNFTKKSVKRRIKKTQANIDRYLAKLDAVDEEEPEIRELTAEELRAKTLKVVADAGYYDGNAIVECYDADITALVPKTDTTNRKAKGQYTKADFSYDATRNEYICPANKRLKRWEKEGVLDQAATNLKQARDAMRQRKALVEHPFGTLKQAMGATHFLTKRLPSVRAEMSLHVLA